MSKKFGLGLAVGALVGAVAGILTAPKSGEETRKDLKLKAKKVADVATQKTGEVAENAGEFVEETKEKMFSIMLVSLRTRQKFKQKLRLKKLKSKLVKFKNVP